MILPTAAYADQFCKTGNNGIFRCYLRIMLAKFSDFNISGYATFSFKFALKKNLCRYNMVADLSATHVCPLGAWWTVYKPQVTLRIMGSKYALATRKMYV